MKHKPIKNVPHYLFQILSKEFTKLNNNHPYRIHYLGMRPHNSLALHKKFAKNEKTPFEMSSIYEAKPVQKYTADFKKIVQSYGMSERLKGNQFYKQTFFYRAFEGMNPTLNLQKQYVFNSIFEAGNLDCVIKVKQTQFDLFLRIDSNTKGHVQWFYFSIKNNSKKQKVKLNICNLSKQNTLYENGMKPFIFSKQKHKKSGIDWFSGGQNLCLEKKQLRYEYLQDKINKMDYYCLQFQYEFEHQNDEVFFAYCIPYTYSKLIQEIKSFQDKYVHKGVLGKSLSGVNIPILHITNFQEPSMKKKNILVTGRMHPGESNSSHMLQGLIQFLLSNQKTASKLRKKVNFFIIPMVNPDGVIIGNTRTSTAGKDLNRQFIVANRDIHPQVYLVKNFARKLHTQHQIFLYLDFHGHSKKKNTFCYGPAYGLGQPNYYKCRIFPKLIEKLNSNFRYHSCSFAIEDVKKRTARGVFFEQMKINFTYTIETSIGYYYSSQEYKTYQFSISQWKKMGKSIGQGLQKFIQGYQQFEEYIRQRRETRQKKKRSQKSRNLEYQAQQEQAIVPYVKNQPLKISYKQKNLFNQLINDIKTSNKQVKNANYIKQLDQDVESDQNDQNEDFEPTKMKQFNNLIVQANQKSTKIFASKQKNQKEEDYSHYINKQQINETDQQRNFFMQFQNDFKSKMMNSTIKRQIRTSKQISSESRQDMMKSHYLNRSKIRTQFNHLNKDKLPLQMKQDIKKNAEKLQFKRNQQQKHSFNITQFLLFGFQENIANKVKNRRQSSYIDSQNHVRLKVLPQNFDKRPQSHRLFQRQSKFSSRLESNDSKAKTINKSLDKKSTNYQFKFDQIQILGQNAEKLTNYKKSKAAKNVAGPASFYGIRNNQNLKLLNKKRVDIFEDSLIIKKQQISMVSFI